MFKLVKISGHSMEPNIPNGSFKLVNTLIYKFRPPRVGEIVLFKYGREKKLFCKRITSSNGQNDNFGVAGDNLNDSLDSRKIGAISKPDIIGKVI